MRVGNEGGPGFFSRRFFCRAANPAQRSVTTAARQTALAREAGRLTCGRGPCRPVRSNRLIRNGMTKMRIFLICIIYLV